MDCDRRPKKTRMAAKSVDPTRASSQDQTHTISGTNSTCSNTVVEPDQIRESTTPLTGGNGPDLLLVSDPNSPSVDGQLDFSTRDLGSPGASSQERPLSDPEVTPALDLMRAETVSLRWTPSDMSVPVPVEPLANHLSAHPSLHRLSSSDPAFWPDLSTQPAEILNDTLPSECRGSQWPGTPRPAATSSEHPTIIRGQDYWASFRCNPYDDRLDCPRTAGILLEELSRIPESDNLWGWLGLDLPSPLASVEPMSMPIHENVRDKLSATSQSFLQKALDVHQLDPATIAGVYPSPGLDVSPRFLTLPPAATLAHFLQEYMRHFEPFYPLLPSGMLDPNALMNQNSKAATLLILLMISQGAMSDPTSEGRRLSGGLTEVCRISLYDMIERDVPTCHNHLLVHSAFLFIIQAAWSGDKWLMDIGLGQRGIYLSVSGQDRSATPSPLPRSLMN
jgi:hypothetical protein